MAKRDYRESDCWDWEWTRSKKGYGIAYAQDVKKNRQAHRVAYEAWVGPIPEGLVIDHLCRNPSCVNPWHMEPVTIAENTARGLSFSVANAAKTHCHNGHEFTEENTYWKKNRRVCRICVRDYMLDWRDRQKALAQAPEESE